MVCHSTKRMTVKFARPWAPEYYPHAPVRLDLLERA